MTTLQELREICNTEQRVCGDRGTEWFAVTAYKTSGGDILVQLDDGSDDRPVVRTDIDAAADFIEWLLHRRAPGYGNIANALPMSNVILCPRLERAVVQVRANR